ncbi:hypothetical protein F0L68_39745 [Solihabitans fulvus]|uniref:Uncharacterized protein n=1 Tax=Solihabitans fulvus TaxID=1892852 RepID=A0A5B2WBP2_9PSEU|nr:hypothetical protein [Solihabitans fulvus]KAA2248685.1 hypothetical protein F0L68_39745 [Solihabitans fulvus]
MTTVDERPRNGHSVEIGVPLRPLDTEPAPPATPAPRESERIAQLRQQVADRAAERDLLNQLAEIQSDEVFEALPSEQERTADRKVAERIRSWKRQELLKAGKSEVLRSSRNRRWSWWDERAERARDRILDPARAIGADYRKLVASSAAAFGLVAGGVAYMSANVHHGLVGVEGTWTAYLVEPLASVLLAISMIAQFTGRKRGIAIPRKFYWFDAALAAASVLLNVVPSGIRFGWRSTDLVAHILVPALVLAAVIAWHLASSLYGTAIALSKDDPVTRDRLLVLRKALADGTLPPETSASGVIKYLRTVLPTGIGHTEGRRLAKQFLGF